jgi:hypothetical protein
LGHLSRPAAEIPGYLAGLVPHLGLHVSLGSERRDRLAQFFAGGLDVLSQCLFSRRQVFWPLRAGSSGIFRLPRAGRRDVF